MNEANTYPKYMQHLDSLRMFAVLAVLAVLVSHFLGGRLVLPFQVVLPFHWGRLGVLLFFVLSGFLITRILLEARGNSGALRAFVVRRGLRIWPAYFFMLAVLGALGVKSVQINWPWLVTYTTNIAIGFGLTAGSPLGGIAHLWSVAAEEQFYILWPLIVLFVSRKWLQSTVLGLIVCAVIYRISAGSFLGLSWHATAWSLMGVSDCLGFGVLLAIGWHREKLIRMSVWLGWPMLLAMQMVFISVDDPRKYLPYLALGDFAAGLAFFSLVHFAAMGVKGPTRAILNLRPVQYLGKISYGIYLWHLPVLVAYQELWSRNVGVSLSLYSAFFLLTAASVAAAMISWHLLERPINQFKHRIPMPGVR